MKTVSDVCVLLVTTEQRERRVAIDFSEQSETVRCDPRQNLDEEANELEGSSVLWICVKEHLHGDRRDEWSSARFAIDILRVSTLMGLRFVCRGSRSDSVARKMMKLHLFDDANGGNEARCTTIESATESMTLILSVQHKRSC